MWCSLPYPNFSFFPCPLQCFSLFLVTKIPLILYTADQATSFLYNQQLWPIEISLSWSPYDNWCQFQTFAQPYTVLSLSHLHVFILQPILWNTWGKGSSIVILWEFPLYLVQCWAQETLAELNPSQYTLNYLHNLSQSQLPGKKA